MGRIFVLAIACVTAAPARAAEVNFTVEAKQLHIRIDAKPFAEYIFHDEQVLRPYFTRLHAPGGAVVTRNHPPVSGKDLTDHATMHPGLWLAFGQLGGADFWRNKGRVEHVEFALKPTSGKGEGRFAVRNRYRAGDRILCEEVARITVLSRPQGYLLSWDSTFRPQEDLAFGDQEEMGLGVRVATPLSVQKGGRIVNSAGQVNQKQAWGQQADWCDYSGPIDGKRAGVLLMPHPENFRRSWFHARDYGLLVANPFGQKAFTRGKESRVEVERGESFRLRFGVLIHDGKVDAKAALEDYRKLTASRRGE